MRMEAIIPASLASDRLNLAPQDIESALADENARGACRTLLKTFRERLYNEFDDGVPITDLVAERSHFVDQLLRALWSRFLPSPMAGALIAVGGYGRSELHPGSDIDILLLIHDFDDSSVTQAIETLIVFLWDIGLEVGHAVRTVEQCIAEAEDVTVMTNLIESRLLDGDAELYQRLDAALSVERIWPSDRFFEAKIEEQRARWQKYGDTAYNLEPNIKENPGGLRDIQMIGWVAKRHFGARTLHDLVDHGFLTEGEYLTLAEGQTYLWRLRFVLHRLRGRREDRLLFDYQRTLAETFGFTDAEENLGVEQFMQQYYRTVIELNRLNEMLLQLFQEAILLKDRLGEPVEINRRFQSRSGFLEVTQDDVFKRNPVALLELFYIMQMHPELQNVRASTIRLIREHRHLIDDQVRGDIRARSLFMEMLRHSSGLTRTLRRMNRWGVLAAYIPAFANIVGRMQYDLFHVYTVDEHTLRLLRNIRRFTVSKHTQEFPLCSAIIQTIPKIELLYLAGLFHDIAKGRGGDHSVLGARDAWDFCQQHGISDYDSRLVVWLVEKHLLMSMTAQRRDIGDPDVIQEFAATVGETDRLDYLYLLTVSDMRATNPARWNSWKDALLRELYQNTRHALARGLDNPQAQDELISHKQTEALRLLTERGADEANCKRLWATYSLDYFLHNSPDEIAWQTRVVLGTPENESTVAIRAVTARGGTEVFLFTEDRDHLFGRTTALLDRLGVNVMDARIMTTDDGSALNAYYVLEENGSPLQDLERQREIKEALERELEEQSTVAGTVSRSVPRRLRHFSTATEISFADDERNHRTVMRLITLDRPGLLAEVGAVFESCGIRLHNAKITTVGAEVEDVFFITTKDAAPITCNDALTCLRQAIYDRLEAK